MKYLIVVLLIMLGCCMQPDGYTTDGTPYRISEQCTKSHLEKKTGYHWGYCWSKGYCYHYTWQCWNTCTKTVCDEKRIDTIYMEKEIK